MVGAGCLPRHLVECLAELHAHELVHNDLAEVARQVLVAGPKVGVDGLLEDALLSDPGLLEDGVRALNGDDALVHRLALAYAPQAPNRLGEQVKVIGDIEDKAVGAVGVEVKPRRGDAYRRYEGVDA